LRLPRLTLHLFGTPSLELDGERVRIDRRKAIALLAYLAVESGRHGRDALAGLFWPDFDASRASAYLERTLWEINQILGEGWIVVDRDTVQFDPHADVWLDVRRFGQLMVESRGRSHRQIDCSVSETPLAEAIALQPTDFMAGFSLKDAPAFDEWAFFQAEGLRRELAQALERLARCDVEAGRIDDAVPLTQRWLALDPLNEAAHRQLMQAYAQSARTADALHQYQECVRILSEELGVAPQPETTALYEHIRLGGREPAGNEAGAAANEAPPAAAALAPPRPVARSHLPTEPTPFVGRASELAEAAALLANPDCRLITMLGPGGVGKTRIAIQVAQEHSAEFAYGAHFVALAHLTTPDAIVPAVADAIGFGFFSQGDLADAPGRRQQLLGYLSEKHMLLVLDNFEHLMSAVDWVSELLRAAPRLRVIVTSRERLNLQEEWVLDVRGMRIPPPNDSSLDEYSSARLFVQSARRAKASFTLADEERQQVVRICRLVEGLPLGIELAAAWTKTLSVREIADEIEHELDFLTTHLRNAPERHRSLRAVFDSSWTLLSPEQQRAFQRLAVFRGGFLREAAVAVAGASLPVLTAFIDKSILYRDSSGRYDLHQAVRQYAGQKLEASTDDRAATLKRHGAYYADFVQARTAALRGHGQRQALAEFRAELENIRAGWFHALSLSDAASQLEVMDAYLDGLFWFTDMQSRFHDGESWADAALLALVPGQDFDEAMPEARALIVTRLLTWRGWCRFRMSQGARSQADMRQALALLERFPGCAPTIRASVSAFALTTGAIRERAEFERMFDDSLDIFRENKDPWGIAMALTALAEMNADPETAKQLFRESLSICLAAGDERSAASMLIDFAELHHNLGEFAEARRRFDQSLALSRALEDRYAMSLCLDCVGYVARQMGDLPEARRLHEDSLALSREIGDVQGVAGSLDNLGLVDLDAGDIDQAARRFKEGLALRRNGDGPWTWIVGVSLEHLAATALALGNLPEAERWVRESVALMPHWSIGRSRLGDVMRARGRFAEAADCYRSALSLSLDHNHLWSAPVAVHGLAHLRAAEGDLRGAAAMLLFASRHPACDYGTRCAAERALAEWTARLAPPELAQAESDAQGLTFRSILASVDPAIAEVARTGDVPSSQVDRPGADAS
jgi:predicted ATPase/DNA-binding SARP family transcriptional activator/Tfp pilus assembly protein PilF